MYSRIEAKQEPAGVRVRLYGRNGTTDDFLYDARQFGFTPSVEPIIYRVASTFGVSTFNVRVVNKFENERN